MQRVRWSLPALLTRFIPGGPKRAHPWSFSLLGLSGSQLLSLYQREGKNQFKLSFHTWVLDLRVLPPAFRSLICSINA